MYDFAPARDGALAWGETEPLKSSLVVQHAVVIDGHKTSISLEDAFWTSLKEIAQERGESLAHLVTSINAERQSANLSSVLRVFVLEYYRNLFHSRTAVSLVPDLELISPDSNGL